MTTINNLVDVYLQEGEAYLDQFIESGSEQDLFVASYLHGHYSVVAASLMSNLSQFKDLNSVQLSFKSAMMRSVHNAIENNELNQQDAAQVTAMLDALFESINHTSNQSR